MLRGSDASVQPTNCRSAALPAGAAGARPKNDALAARTRRAAHCWGRGAAAL